MTVCKSPLQPQISLTLRGQERGIVGHKVNTLIGALTALHIHLTKGSPTGVVFRANSKRL